ncbi:MAG TPA: phage minor head protein, partial [Fibrobacteria bacterium]|nr:phage minor head protein [Fibrobacteria bacterium]
MPTLLDGDFKELFKKPPASVLAYFREKGLRGPDSHWDWSDTMRHAHDRAFTVAKATSLDIVRDIRDSLTTAIQEGQSFQSWRRGIVPTLQAKGWWGKQMVTDPRTGEETMSQLGSTRRMETIYRTNMATAYEAGHHSAQMEVVDDMPYWRYVARAPGKNRRPDHQALHNIVKRWDDPFWASH